MQPSRTMLWSLAVMCALAGAHAAWVPPTDPTATLPFGKHSTLHLSSPDRPFLTCDVTGTAAVGAPVARRALAAPAVAKKGKVNDTLPVTCDREPSPFFWDAWKSGYILAAAENSTKIPGQGHIMPNGGAITLSSMATKKACAPAIPDGPIVCNASKIDPGASYRVYLASPPALSSVAAPQWWLRRAIADLRTWLLSPETAVAAAENDGAPIEVHLLHVESDRFCAPGAGLHAPLSCDVDPKSLVEDDVPPVVLVKVVQLWPAETSLEEAATA